MLVLKVNPCLFRQRCHLSPHLLQHVQLDLAPRQSADEAVVGKGLDAHQDAIDQIGQDVHVRLVQPPLGDPRGAHPDTRRQCGLGVAGNGVLVGHQTSQVQYADGGLSPQWKAGAGGD